MKIAIIGGGWTGCHLAISLSKKGHDVTILERNTDIFQGVSGNFGIRLHKGLPLNMYYVLLYFYIQFIRSPLS